MASAGKIIGMALGEGRGFASTDAGPFPGHSANAPVLIGQGAPNSPPEGYVDAREGADFLSIHAKTLLRLARAGVVPAYSFGDGVRRHWRFLISELDKWMKTKVNSSAHPIRPRPADGRRK